MLFRPKAWVGLSVAVVVFAVGCAGTTQREVHPDLPSTGRSNAVTLPLDRYSPTPEEQLRSDRAQARLERVCLAGFGLPWSGPDPADVLAGKGIRAAWLVERFGLVDAAQARRYGYHRPPWSSRVSPVEAVSGRHRDEPPAEVAKVLSGAAGRFNGKPVPPDGCRGAAFRRLSKGADTGLSVGLVTRLEQQAATRANGDERLTALFADWATCMRTAGFHYPTPGAAARDARWRGGELTSEEIGVAEADVACKERIGFVRTTAAVTAEYQRRAIADHATQLRRVKRSLAARAENVSVALAMPIPSR